MLCKGFYQDFEKMNKQVLRKKYLEKRKSFTQNEIDFFSEKINNQILNEIDLNNKFISIFMPIERHNEVNTRIILNSLSTFKTTIGLPYSSLDKNVMYHKQYSQDTILKVNKWNIPEPQNGKELIPSDFDIVFIPLLICDGSGNRVGYGKGYYDRFLAECKDDCLFIGLNYFSPISEEIAIEDTDIALTHLVTPEKNFKF